METVLSFFSDMILFTAGIAVFALWLFIIVFVIDEAIDLFIGMRNERTGRTQEED